MNAGLITATAAGSANALSITTTNRVTPQTTVKEASVQSMSDGVVPFTTDAEISEREEDAIAIITLRSAPAFVAATS